MGYLHISFEAVKWSKFLIIAFEESTGNPQKFLQALGTDLEILSKIIH